MLSAAALAGCTKAETLPEVPGNVLLSVSATIPENLATKSYGDGGTADILYAEAYTHEGTRVLRKECSVENGSASIELQLAKGRSYDIIFWAQCKDCKAYDNSDLREIRLEEQLAIEDFSGAERMDAFCKVMQDVEVTSSADIAVILERPLAQLNISSSGELSGDASSTALILKGIPEYYQPLTGKTGGDGDINLNAAYNLPCDDKLVTENGSYEYMAMAYVFAESQPSPISGTIVISYRDDTTKTLEIAGVELSSNCRTNMIYR